MTLGLVRAHAEVSKKAIHFVKAVFRRLFVDEVADYMRLGRQYLL